MVILSSAAQILYLQVPWKIQIRKQDKDLHAFDVLEVRKVRFICLFLLLGEPGLVCWGSEHEQDLQALKWEPALWLFCGAVTARVIWWLCWPRSQVQSSWGELRPETERFCGAWGWFLVHFQEGFLRVIDQRCLVMSKLSLVKGGKLLLGQQILCYNGYHFIVGEADLL